MRKVWQARSDAADLDPDARVRREQPDQHQLHLHQDRLQHIQRAGGQLSHIHIYVSFSCVI